MKLIVASNNRHKIEEIKSILSPYFGEIVSQKETGILLEPEEDGKTFLDNARIKARAIFELAKTAVIADDSGLCVDALNGAPGVYSARYAGTPCDDKKNNQKLLVDLSGKKNRHAHYSCAMVLLVPSEEGTKEFLGYGEVSGEILCEERGSGGFGYDPLFFCPPLNKTFAQLTAEEKNGISHRKNALDDLVSKIK